MAYPIASKMTLSTGAYADSVDQIVPTYQLIGKGRLRLVIKGSAIGQLVTIKVNGMPICDRMAIPYTGTTGTLDVAANVMLDQVVSGGRIEFFISNTTAGALTSDFVLTHEPLGK